MAAIISRVCIAARAMVSGAHFALRSSHRIIGIRSAFRRSRLVPSSSVYTDHYWTKDTTGGLQRQPTRHTPSVCGGRARDRESAGGGAVPQRAGEVDELLRREGLGALHQVHAGGAADVGDL